MEQINLAGQTAIVTGSGSGIGKATAIRLASAGAAVVCFDLLNAEDTVKAIHSGGGVAVSYNGDASRQSDWSAAYRAGEDLLGPADILVNIAGRNCADNVVDFSETELDHMIQVNLKSVVLGMRQVIPHMIKVGSGKIVNTTTGATLFGVPNQLSYSASKGGINAVTIQTAIDYARHNIQINCVSPGLTNTPMVARADKAVTAKVAAATPAGRLAEPSEIAAAILFLVSPLSSFVNGIILSVDGGLLVS